MHVDLNNDATALGLKYNYNYVVCAWDHISNANGSLSRRALLGYSRRSVGDFIRRSQCCSGYITKVIKPWVASLPLWRKRHYPNCEVFHTSYFGEDAQVDEFGYIVFKPTLNKQVTYLSAFADCFITFKEKYECIHKVSMNLEKQLECILPIVFCNSGHQYVRVFKAWIADPATMKHCSIINLSYEFVKFSEKHWTSCRTGGHPRHQPTFNITPTPTWILVALRRLRDVLLKSLHQKNIHIAPWSPISS